MKKMKNLEQMTYGNYPDLTSVKKILVIKLRQLGDVLLTGPVFSTLKAQFPLAKIDAYVYRESRDLLEGHPAIDECILYDRSWKNLPLFKRLKKEFSLWQIIRKNRYDLVINLTEGDRGAIAARASKAQVRVGFKPKGRWQKNLYTHIAKNCPNLRHTVEKNLDALRRIGIFPRQEDKELFLHVSEPSLIKEPFVLIHPTSRWRFKCWPVQKMRELTQELLKMGKKVVFSSGPDLFEQEMVQEITQGLDVMNLSGKLTLKQLTALIDQSELLISVDSLPFHMANALKKPVVAIFGPTSDVTWGPWRNPDAQVISQNFSCRPCYQDGCGGSKVSDCLVTLPVQRVLDVLLEQKNFRSYPQKTPIFK